MFKRKTSEGSLPERRLSLLLSHRLPGNILTQGTTSSFPLSSSQLQKNKINTIQNQNNNPSTQISPDTTISPVRQEKLRKQEEGTLSTRAFPQRINRITSLSLKEGYYFKTIPQIDKNKCSLSAAQVATAPFASSSSTSSQQQLNFHNSMNQHSENPQAAAFLSAASSQKQLAQAQIQFQKKSGEERKINLHINPKQFNNSSNNQNINTINAQSTQASFNFPQSCQEASLKLDFGSSRRKNTQTKSLSSIIAADSRFQLNDFKNFLRESENYQRLPQKTSNKQQLSLLQDFMSSHPQHFANQTNSQTAVFEQANPSLLSSFYSGKSNQLKALLNPNIYCSSIDSSPSRYPVIISHLSAQNNLKRNTDFQAVKTKNNSSNNNQDFIEETSYQYKPHRKISIFQRKNTPTTTGSSANSFLNIISREGQQWKTTFKTNKITSTKESRQQLVDENQENNQLSLFPSRDRFKQIQIQRSDDLFDKYDLEPWQSSVPRDQTESFLVQGDEDADLNSENKNNLFSQL